MKKNDIKKVILSLFTLVAVITTNAQTYLWEFTDAASGTTPWAATSGFSGTTQKKHSAIYTTSAVSNPVISVNPGVVVPDVINTAQNYQILGITIRVSANGPDYLRVSFPKYISGSGRWTENLQITKGDSEFKTYYVNMASYGNLAGTPGTNPRTDWRNRTIDDVQIQFKTYNAGDVNGDDFNTAGATIEIERLEFVNNAWSSGASPGNRNSGNNGNWVFGKPANDGTQEIIIPTNADQPNINVDHNVKSIYIGAGVKLSNSVARTINTEKLVFGPGASFLHHTGGNYADVDEVTYKVDSPDDKWHLLTSPVNVEQYDDAWITANNVASGTGNNRGISTYNNGTPDGTTGHWRYFQAAGTATSFTLGIGYGIKRNSSGISAFTGSGFVNAATISPTVSQNTNSWNLVGSPYTAPLDIADFITDNSSNLDDSFQAAYVWDADSGASGAYVSKTSGFLYPGQAFFVNAKSGATTVAFNVASLDLNYAGTNEEFYRTSNSLVKLKVSEGLQIKSTEVSYLSGRTEGLDKGFDIGLFDGVESDLKIYTHLLSDNTGIAFERQTLPDSDLESMVIPVGVKAAAGKEITFTADALNLPTGIKVFLEDRVANTFTRLDEANSEYKITLANAVDGVGRFYLYTTQSSLSVDDTIKLSGVSIFKTDASTLRIAGLPNGKASISLFNILGKQVMTGNFDANGTKDISLPKLEIGVYFAKVQTVSGKISKKIILE